MDDKYEYRFEKRARLKKKKMKCWKKVIMLLKKEIV